VGAQVPGYGGEETADPFGSGGWGSAGPGMQMKPRRVSLTSMV
jgi:hypothetical protein